MKSVYYDSRTRSIIDCYEMTGIPPHGWVVARISVLPAHRGQGWARRLMNQVLADADSDWKILYLSVQPDGSPGSLNRKQLMDFYGRCGFNSMREWHGLNMVRFPEPYKE